MSSAAGTEQNLIQKLAGVMADVKHVPKNGRNSFHNYNYATEADIADAVRDGMAQRGVMLIPSVERCDWRTVKGKNGDQSIATLTVKFRATDGKDSIDFTVMGEGQDSGDKATYKAMTGATKYALLKLFLIPTGDDPERDEEEEKPKRQSAPRPAPQPSASSPPGKPTPLPVTPLWNRLAKEMGKEKAKERLEAASKKAFGDKVPPSTEWTAEDVAKVAAIVDDVPF
jgi:hypothetical protein